MKTKLSDKLFNYLFDKHKILKDAFTETIALDDNELEWTILITRNLLSELVNIAKKEDPALKLRWDYVNEDLEVRLDLKEKIMTITLAFNPEPFTDRDYSTDCLGDYDINIKTYIVDFSYRIET